MSVSTSRTFQRALALLSGIGAAALFGVSRQLEGRDRGLLMAAAIGAVLLFVISAAFIATRRNIRK